MTVQQKMSVERTRDAFASYYASEHQDTGRMAPDVVFRVMATGQEHRTPEGAQAMLDYFYHVAFDAKAEVRNLVVGEGIVVLEADFVGRHIAEFAGVEATGKGVRVPLAVIYDLRDDQIVEGRVYFEMPVFFAQVERRP